MFYPAARLQPKPGGRAERLEGRFSGDLVMIEFANREIERAWYRSSAYLAILPLRTEHSRGEVFLIDQVEMPHRATDVLRPARENGPTK
ncbi:DUF1330 domain-containing protein [Paraburkholderia silvatlantica]|nr:DUF1330 domain-containing protein [Paraburkholderia silvatlantica]